MYLIKRFPCPATGPRLWTSTLHPLKCCISAKVFAFGPKTAPTMASGTFKIFIKKHKYSKQ